MADLIERVRLHVGDTGTTPVFTDQQIQDALDTTRVEQRLARTRPRPTVGSGGAIAYLDFFTHDTEWEGVAGTAGSVPLLQDASYATVTPDSSDLINGIFHFNTQPGNGALLLITGATYDTHRAGATIARQWAARVVLDFDFQTDQQSFSRSQKREGLLELARMLDSQAKISRVCRDQADAGFAHRTGTPTFGGTWGEGVL